VEQGQAIPAAIDESKMNKSDAPPWPESHQLEIKQPAIAETPTQTSNGAEAVVDGRTGRTATPQPWTPANTSYDSAWVNATNAPVQANISSQAGGFNGNGILQEMPKPAPHCRGCNAVMEHGSKFCGECGTIAQAESQIPACHLCGAPLEASAKFCGECGSKQVHARTVSASPASYQAGAGPAASFNNGQGRPGNTQAAQAPVAAGAPTQRGWVVKLLKMLE
jgi:RNA polymerase subunit RPABC4/transcription elongation factor Spt4